MMVGSTPAYPMDRMVARVDAFFFAVSLDMSTMDEAAALRGDELPGVITPSFLKEA